MGDASFRMMPLPLCRNYPQTSRQYAGANRKGDVLMSTKLLSALVGSVFLMVPGVALAGPPDHCVGQAVNQGDVNKDLHNAFGSPGQVTGVPANDAAALFNGIRNDRCLP